MYCCSDDNFLLACVNHEGSFAVRRHLVHPVGYGSQRAVDSRVALLFFVCHVLVFFVSLALKPVRGVHSFGVFWLLLLSILCNLDIS